MKKEKSNLKKPFYKKWWFWLIVVIVIIGAIGSQGSNDSNKNDDNVATEQTKETHIYDNAEIKDVMNGTGTDKLGEYSVIIVSSSECTDDALADWYYNYVNKNDYNFCMILYSDSDTLKGCYSIKGIVEKGVGFVQDEAGDYSVDDSFDTTQLVPSDDGKKLTVLSETQGLDKEAIKEFVENNIPDEYKSNDYYYCDLLTPTDGQGAIVSIQIADDAFADETSCTDAIKTIVSALYSDTDKYSNINSFEFSFIKSDMTMTYMINIDDAQSINIDDLDASLSITSF